MQTSFSGDDAFRISSFEIIWSSPARMFGSYSLRKLRCLVHFPDQTVLVTWAIAGLDEKNFLVMMAQRLYSCDQIISGYTKPGRHPVGTAGTFLAILAPKLCIEKRYVASIFALAMAKISPTCTAGCNPVNHRHQVWSAKSLSSGSNSCLIIWCTVGTILAVQSQPFFLFEKYIKFKKT